MTFSLVGRCARTGMFGVIVTSSSICVASRCAWASAGNGAIATQNLTDPGLGDLGISLLQRGLSAEAVCDELVRSDGHPEHRQHLVIDNSGRTAQYSGTRALRIHAFERGDSCVAAGNILRSDAVPSAMVVGFSARPDAHIAARMLDAVDAGLDAGGEMRLLRSAGLLVVATQRWPIVDLRVDDHEKPLTELRRLWGVYEPLMDGYIARARDPQLSIVPSIASADQ
jgi:uncharacterized Ntn-hydrolase superfamily protein